MAVLDEEPHGTSARREARSISEQIGPIRLRASLHETIWGGQRLREIAGKELPEGKRIGESWETALDSVVMTTPHAGQTLGRLVAAYGKALLGSRAVAVYGERFPLLTKFIDAHDWLSVQVHPDDDYAATHERGKLGKTECWYILATEPGARVVYGLAHETSPEDLRAAIAAQALEPLMRTIEVKTGDVIFVPAGTVHAIGAGVTLYELQEYSDVTYRLYDFGRLQANGQPRELHVERALDVIHYTPSTIAKFAPVALPTQPGVAARRVLTACRYFVEEEFVLDGSALEPKQPSSCRILTVVQGALEIDSVEERTHQDEPAETVRLAAGDTAVLPACMGNARLSGSATVIRSYVPELDDPSLALWIAAQRF